jgi:hypothetical protein
MAKARKSKKKCVTGGHLKKGWRFTKSGKCAKAKKKR